MGGTQQPFLYEAERSSSYYPEKPFDPKAVTRASWEPKPAKPKQDGPLVQFNRHPDAHEVIGGRQKNYKTMGQRTKAWIKGMRVVQLLMRVVQFVGATAVLVLVILISNMPDLLTWVMRITAGVIIVHTAYGIYHLSRPAGYRTPASSAAYQVFSAFADFVVLLIYVYGVLSIRNHTGNWTTLLSNADTLPYLETSFYYILIGSGGLHLATLAVAFWLGIKFRQITLMPPDMNPLEDRFTTRAKKQNAQKQQQHTRNKSSIATADTYDTLSGLDNDKTLLSRPPSVPFLHTRTGSRDSRLDLPSRQSQNSADTLARNSVTNLKRSSVVVTPADNGRGTYTEVPLHEGYSYSPSSRGYNSSRLSGSTQSGSRPNSGTPDTSIPSGPASGSGSPIGLGINNGSADPNRRQTKFTETWYTSDSLVNRTQQRNKALNTLVLNASGQRRNYEVVSQAYDFPESDDEGSDPETVRRNGGMDDENSRYDDYNYASNEPQHPNPLRSNPPPKRARTPFYPPGQNGNINRPMSAAPTVSSMTSSVHTSTTHNVSVLGELHLNDRRVSGGPSGDIADAIGGRGVDTHGKKDAENGPSPLGRGLTAGTLSPPQQGKSGVSRQATKRWTWAPRNRDSSIQPESEFYSKPYGELKSATPPVMVGQDLSSASAAKNSPRQVSSGNDYDLGSDRYLYYGEGGNTMSSSFGRRNVSGKIAEEGRAYSRYSMLND